MGRRSKKKSKNGGGSTPSKKKKQPPQQQQRAAPQDALEAAASTSTMEAALPTSEPMLVDESGVTSDGPVGGAHIVSPSPPAKSISPSKRKGVQPPPPPPAIPPPQAPDGAPAPPSSKASSAVMDAGGITLGLLSGSPSASQHQRAQIVDESSPEKMARIDVSDAERRRRAAQLASGEEFGGGFDRGLGRRMYEEDNAGYGRQLLVATSEHQALPSISSEVHGEGETAAARGDGQSRRDGRIRGDGGGSEDTNTDGAGSTGHGLGADLGATSTAPPAPANANADANGGSAAASNASSTVASRRAEAAARLKALRGVGADSGPSSSRSNRKIPAPPTIAPPSSTTASTSEDMAAKIQKLNDNRGKGTTAAQQRAAELGEFCLWHIYIYIYIIYMFRLLCGDGRDVFLVGYIYSKII